MFAIGPFLDSEAKSSLNVRGGVFPHANHMSLGHGTQAEHLVCPSLCLSSWPDISLVRLIALGKKCAGLCLGAPTLG